MTASGNGGRFNATSWAETSIANAVSGNDYMEFTITPNAGYQFSVSSVVVQWERSATGNTAIALRSSVDGYATDLGGVTDVADNTSPQTFTWTFSQANSSSPVTYRFYSYAEGTSGSGGPGDSDGNDIVVNGAVTTLTSSVAAVVTLPVTNVLNTSVTAHGNITSIGGSNPTERGFCWDLSSNPDPDVTDSKTSERGSFSTGLYSLSITGLTPFSEYKLRAFVSNSFGTSYGAVVTFTTALPEPANFPTSFTATANSSSQITTTWADATGDQLPTGYLVKASASASPTAPVDGTPETDSPLVMNVAPGTQTAVFANLDPSTTYQFAIWPYTNTDPQINYKTDGQQPTASATTAALYTVYWDGGATTSNWSDAANWSGDALPTTGTIVQIDNTHVPGSYSISLPTGNIRTAVYRLIIQPTAGNTITVTLPAENTYGATNDAGLVVGDKTSSTDDIVLRSGAVLVNASGASAGNGIQVNSLSNGTIRIENGAKYIHKSDRATGGIVPCLSTSGGTETGVFEYDVPGNSPFFVSSAGKNYGSLVLSKSSGTNGYSASGINQTLTIRGDFTINPGVSFSTTMTGTLQLAGNLTSNGSKLNLPAGLAVSFNGAASQVVTGADSIRFEGSATVASTSTVRLAANTSLEVKGVLTNQGTAASLILSQGARLNHRTDGVAATKEWEIASNGSYHFVAMPFSGTMPAICDGNFAPLTTNFNQSTGETYDFYQWSEATDLASTVWNNLKGDAWALNTTDFGNPPTFAAGRGYAVRYFSGFAGSTTKAVTGTLANGSQTVAITASNNKYNLIGNPYPSSIDWKAATGWGREVLATDGSAGHSIWIWNDAAGNYGAYSSGSAADEGTNSVGRYVAPGQGFFVKAASSGSLTMDNNVRKSSPSTFLKSTAPVLALVVTNPATGYSDETRLEFGHPANEGGVAKWWSLYPEAPSLYSTMEGRNLSISFLTDVASNPEIPLAFRAGVDGDYSLLVTQGLEGFERVTLHDLATGTTQELLQNPVYPFSASTTDAPNRFKLTFGSVGIDTPVASPVSIYTYANRLHILNATNATVVIINMAGQVVERFHINNENTFSRLLNLRAGAYVVKAVNGLSVNTQRIVIN
ncbi:MAG: T9SS type A sorting domain-containing protein [Bacteroidales bacterium]|nr:T9SS type A sorting domain-containing protein [Bacteroidales bacterium]